MSKRIEIKEGQKFGLLTIIKEVPPLKKWDRRFQCVCECGSIIETLLASLRYGRTKSCGCIQSEVVKKMSTIHGHSRPNKTSREYISWQAIKLRCYNPNNHAYPNYGGRGIVMCDEWLNDFQRFLADMGPRPLGTSIDRIDNDKGYSPDNCRWADRKQQGNNTRANRKLTYQGKTQNITQWAKELCIPRLTISRRLNRLKWSVSKALGTPSRLTKQKLSITKHLSL